MYEEPNHQHAHTPPPSVDRQEQGDWAEQGHERRDRMVALIGAFSLTGLVVVASVTLWPEKPIVAETPPVVAEPSAPILRRAPTQANPYESLSLAARSAVVYDLTTGRELYRKNETERLPLASLTKLMTAVVAHESLTPDTRVAITEQALAVEGDSGLFAAERWKLRDLLSFTLVTSSNDGADAVAAAAGALLSNGDTTSPRVGTQSFVGRMNTRAKELGLEDTIFRNPTGLDVGAEATGGVGTARDVARLLAHVWLSAPDLLLETTRANARYVSESGFAHNASNTNALVSATPGLLGGKTGYTDLAGGNLAMVVDVGLNEPVAVVVLGSTLEGRFDDVDALVHATRTYYTSGWYEFETAGTTVRQP